MAMPFATKVVRDCLIAAIAISLAMLIYPGQGQAFSLLAGGIWVCINFYLLAMLTASILSGKGQGKLFIFMLACAKIPASYYLLFWLCRVHYMEPVGLTAGISLLPVVLLFRGLLAAGRAGNSKAASEEGT